MWRNHLDRPDDPRTDDLETERLARDEYDRPRYGSQPPDAHARSSQGYWHGNSHAHDFEQHGGAGSIPNDQGSFFGSAPTGEPLQGGQQRDERAQGRLHEVQAHELMTFAVASVHPETSIERAATLMAETDCGALPVTGDDGVLVGMVTDRDIAIRIIARGREPRNAVVADCMTERVVACYAQESVAECMRGMARYQVRRLPIVEAGGRLVGIISQSDIVRYVARHPADAEPGEIARVVAAVSEPSPAPDR